MEVRLRQMPPGPFQSVGEREERERISLDRPEPLRRVLDEVGAQEREKRLDGDDLDAARQARIQGPKEIEGVSKAVAGRIEGEPEEVRPWVPTRGGGPDLREDIVGGRPEMGGPDDG